MYNLGYTNIKGDWNGIELLERKNQNGLDWVYTHNSFNSFRHKHNLILFVCENKSMFFLNV